MLEAVRDILVWVFRPLMERHKGNLRIAFVCFSFSCIIWLFNKLNNQISTKISLPLKIVYNNHIFFPSKILPKNIQVELGGNGWHLVKNSNFFLPKYIYLNIKFPNSQTKIDTSSIRNHLESQFSNIKIRKIGIERLEIPFERKSHKNILINIDTTSISIAKGFDRSKTITITPNRIVVTGSAKTLSNLPDILHVIIPFQNIDKDFNEQIRLSYFLNNENLKSSHEKVVVKFKVKRTTYAQSK
jgi:YbbR domain-containing protein